MSEARPGKRAQAKLVLLRRISQLFFFTAFLFLFLRTDYNGTDSLSGAVNILFRLDPYLAAAVLLGAKTVVALFLPALLVLVLVVFTGRSFCGWFCPMGTLLDVCRRLFPKKVPQIATNQTWLPKVPRILLIFTLISALLGWGVAGYFDPFSILVRGMAQAIYPWFNWVTTAFFSFTYTQMPEWVNAFTEPVYALMQKTVLPSSQKFFLLPYLSLIMLISLLLFEGVHGRFFCRNFCPLGSMLRLVSSRGLLRGFGGNSECKQCRICSGLCRMGAVGETRKIDMGACNLCFECVKKCPRQIIEFGFAGITNATTKASASGSLCRLSRREFVSTVAAGLVLPTFSKVDASAATRVPLLIRPPGALAEDEFKVRCVRCAECIQVCIGNALQPTLFQAGVDGIFSPYLVARTGYCEFNCTLCGQVCPSGAIRSLTQDEKKKLKIGHAWFNTDLCLPYAKNIPCMVCEEHCPVPEKAIRFHTVTVVDNDGSKKKIKQPYIVDDLCIGCGICETKCPLPGRPAIYITSDGEIRHPERFLPRKPLSPY